MEKKTELIHPDQWLKDLPTEPSIKSYSAGAMISCDKCRRVSPPTRLKCLYCGADLQVSAEQAEHLTPGLRKLEDWEKGFNVVRQSGDSEKIAEIAELLRLDNDTVQGILDAKVSLPLARAESLIEAEVLVKKLGEFGVNARIVEDEDLDVGKMPRRLRGLEIAEDRLILVLFNADEVIQIPFEEVRLIVTGVFFERKVEATESLKKKDEKKILESREIATDEMLIDIYSRADSIGWRIESTGFDFSCLGREKTLFAKENMPKLVEKMRSVAPNAAFDNHYLQVRAELGKVWAISEKNDAGNLERKGVGGMKRTNITIVNNLVQFTRYSRLLWHV